MTPVARVEAHKGALLFDLGGRYGRDVFDRYRSCLTGRAKFVDQPRKCNRATDPERAAQAVAALQAAGFAVEADDEARAVLEQGADGLAGRASDAATGLEQARAMLAERGLTPRPYQETGIAWLRGRRAGLLADDMGLGKTMQVLLALPQRARAVVVAPASVVGAWLAECAKWRPDLTPRRVPDASTWRLPGAGEVVVCSYDVLARVCKDSAAAVQGGAPDLVAVLDEAQMCKGAKTQRTRAAAALCKSALKQDGRVWLLTGTPVQNRPAELRVVLSVAGLFEEAFGTYGAFLRAFGGIDAAQSSSAVAGPAVAEALARVALRRTKDEVARDLPAKSYEDRTVELEGKAAELAEALATVIRDRLAAEGVVLDSLPPAKQKAAIERALTASSDIGDVSAARRVLALAKLPAALAEVEACEEAGEPLVVATTCRDVALAIGSRPGWACIVGGVEQEERTRIVADFQRGDLKGIALTIRAGGTGLTLTRASRFLFVDLDWNPAQNAQAEDRIHRIGQERPCTIVTLVGDCWIERRVLAMCRSKRELSRASLSPLVGRTPSAPGAPDLSAVRAPAPPPVAQQKASQAVAPPLAPPGWIPLDDALRSRLERLAGRGHSLSRWLLKTFTDAIPPRVGTDTCSRRPTLDLIAEREVHQTAADEADAAARRPPRTPAEEHAARALTQLAAADSDHARERNGEGFAASTQDGHRLAAKLRDLGGLRDEEWERAAEIARLHRRQVGT